MKRFEIALTESERSEIANLIRSDLTDLVLDGYVIQGYSAILCGENPNGFTFDMTDRSAMEIMQTFIVYVERIPNDPQMQTQISALLSFVRQMFTPYTGKTEEDY